MNTKTNDIDFAPIPVGSIDSDLPQYLDRVIFDCVAKQTKKDTVARNGVPEGDSLFQRAMGFIKSFGKVVPTAEPPAEKIPGKDPYGNGLLTFCRFSATLKVMLGWAYETPTITCPRQLRCLCQLMLATPGMGVSREELDAQTGTSNSPEYVRILRRKKLKGFGKLIHGEKRKVTRNGKTVRRGFYWMTDVGRLIAQDALAKAGYVHDVNAAHMHMRRLDMDRQRLFAEFGNQHDVKAAVLDKNKSHRERLLHLLLWKGGWISRYDIERLIDAPNPPDVVANVNHHFGTVVIESETRQLRDRDGNVCEVGVYRIAPDWFAKLDAIFRPSVVVN